jgi:hypothetical protein
MYMADDKKVAKRSYFTERNALEVNFSKTVSSPLADPTWNYAFANLEISGHAAQSLTKAVINDLIHLSGDVIRVTPQSYSKIPGLKGSKVDIEFQTADNELICCEMQVHYDKWLSTRNWVK